MTAASTTGLSRDERASLMADLARSRRKRRLSALLFVAPLLVFLTATFLLPIGAMLLRAVHDPVVGNALPQTVDALAGWTGETAPPDAAFAALLADLAAGDRDTVAQVGGRLNFEVPGLRRAVTQAERAARATGAGTERDAVLGASPLWSEPASWAAIQQLGRPVTDLNLLAAVDLDRTADGRIVAVPEDFRVNTRLFLRTLWISFVVTAATLVLGYPAAYLIASVGPRLSGFLMVLVVIPLWTSLLVRTAAWMALLQRNGVINDMLITLGLIGPEGRLQMVFNAWGTVIAMTHILLPFMILPLVSVMKTVPPDQMRAAESLGASRWLAYRRIYIPAVMPGVAAGCLLVFILSIGYYITPALLGGESGQMISNIIAYHVRESLNWGVAAALSAILLAGVLVLYAVHLRLTGGRVGVGA
jgi:putative spermidine/putrescine transport system permease protein